MGCNNQASASSAKTLAQGDPRCCSKQSNSRPFENWKSCWCPISSVTSTTHLECLRSHRQNRLADAGGTEQKGHGSTLVRGLMVTGRQKPKRTRRYASWLHNLHNMMTHVSFRHLADLIEGVAPYYRMAQQPKCNLQTVDCHEMFPGSNVQLWEGTNSMHSQ